MKGVAARFVQPVHDLARRGTDPVCAYLYDIRALRAWVQRIVQCLPGRCQMFYAMKANSERAILEAIAPYVSGFEVASLGEVAKARAVDRNVPIAFGGPGKTDAEIVGALADRVRFLHVESLHELQRVELIAARDGSYASVLLRVNLREALPAAPLTMCGAPTQFGLDEAELPSAFALIDRCPHLVLEGFHLHSLSNQLDADTHLELMRLYLDKTAEWQPAAGRRAYVLNVGGGIGVDYSMAERRFDWSRFCAGLAPLLGARGPQCPELVFECGRFIAAECGAYAVEVIDLKRNHGTTFAVVRGGSHHFRLPASWQHSHPFQIIPLERWPYPFERREVTGEHITVAGQLCTPKDVLARDAYVERLRIGDVLLFTHAGAYGWSISHHDFLSHPHPEMHYVS